MPPWLHWFVLRSAPYHQFLHSMMVLRVPESKELLLRTCGHSSWDDFLVLLTKIVLRISNTLLSSSWFGSFRMQKSLFLESGQTPSRCSFLSPIQTPKSLSGDQKKPSDPEVEDPFQALWVSLKEKKTTLYPCLNSFVRLNGPSWIWLAFLSLGFS